MKPSNNPGGEEVLLAEAPSPRVYLAPTAWSRDGRFLLFDVNDPKAGDVWVLPLDSREPYAFLNSSFVERVARFSPDGRWVAYQSLETGRSEIYIRPFPGPGGQFRVSTSGGGQPRWRHDGQELYFISPNAELMAASIKVQGSAVVPGAPVVLFQTRIVLGGTDQPNRGQYDVARDGRFLINTVVEAEAAPPQINIVQHWTEELKRLVPVD